MARKDKVKVTKTRKPRTVKTNGVSALNVVNEHREVESGDTDARADVLRTCAQIIGVIANAAVSAPNNRDVETADSLRRIQG